MPMVRTANSARKSIKKEEPNKKAQNSKTEVAAKEKKSSSTAAFTGSKTIVSKAPTGKGKVQVAEKTPVKLLAVNTPRISQKEKPQPKKASKNVLREIKYYQSNIGFLIPRAVLVRLVRQTAASIVKAPASNDIKFTSISLNVLHEAVETHLVCVIELAYLAARHAKRVTLFPTDIRLINKIKGIAI